MLKLLIAIGVTAVVAAPTFATHNVPVKATKFQTMFVKSYKQCTSPSESHSAPLSFPACNPPTQSGGTVSFGPKGYCQAKGKLVASTGDIQVQATCADIRNGNDGTGTAFTGNLTLASTIRVTDHNCSTSPCTEPPRVLRRLS